MSLSAQPPLPAPPVETPPLGWLGALGMKSGGRQPGTVNPLLNPSFDMDRYYRAGMRVQVANAVQAAVLNTFSQVFACPAGSAGLIEYVEVNAGLGVAGNVTLAIGWANSAGNLIRAWSSPVILASSEGFVVNDQPFIMGPGELLTVGAFAPAAFTAFNFSFNAWGAVVKS